ncbi:MAG: polymer-forming cytoskeletal protein, partial [Hyphomicrobium sp.]
VLGEVNGSIYAKDLILRTACTVEGQIYHNALVLENGCYFEGRSRRHSNPVGMAPDL